jgi:hypothetical protein
MCGHGRGGCLSVHAADHDALLGVHNRGQSVRAPRTRKTRASTASSKAGFPALMAEE